MRDITTTVDTYLSAWNEADAARRARLIEEAWGRQVILYVGDDFERAYPVRHELDRPLWHHRFLLRPNLDGWLMWQLHGYARVDGIDGGVDLDVMRASPLAAHVLGSKLASKVGWYEKPRAAHREPSRYVTSTPATISSPSE